VFGSVGVGPGEAVLVVAVEEAYDAHGVDEEDEVDGAEAYGQGEVGGPEGWLVG